MCKKVDEVRKQVCRSMVVGSFQRRPYTLVTVSAVIDGRVYQTVEASKVMFPDVWDEERGIHVALGKATKRIATAVVAGEGLYEEFELFSAPPLSNPSSRLSAYL